MILTDFEWCGQSGSLYGLIPCYIDSASGVSVSDSGASISFSTLNTAGSNKWRFLSGRYDSVLAGKFQVCKNPCTTSTGYFDAEDIRAMDRWLCRKDGYHKFKLIKDGDPGYSEFYFNAFLNVKKVEVYGRVAGLEITVTTDAPFAYFEPKTAVMDLSGQGSEYTYVDMSDEVGSLYPYFKIICRSDGDYVIMNKTTGIQSKITGCRSGEIITMDSEHNILSSSIRGDRLLMKSFNFGWMDIKNTLDERKNIYSSNLPCRIEMTYSPIAKIGL